MVSKFDATQQNLLQSSYYSGYRNGKSVLPQLKEIQRESDAIERISFLGKILYPEDDLEPVLLNLSNKEQITGFVTGLSENNMTRLRHLVPCVKCVLKRNPSISKEQKDLITFARDSLKSLLAIETQASEARKAAGIGSLFIDSEYTIPSSLTPSVFSWEDIVHLHHAHLWLRKPSSRQAGESDTEAAQREKEQGVLGDMLCISGSGLSNLIHSLLKSNPQDDCLEKKHNRVREQLPHYSEVDKKTIIDAFEQALINFIYRYTLCSAMIDPEDPIEGYLERRIETLLDKSHYLLIQEEGKHLSDPYDFHNYFQLGKRGKNFITPDIIKETLVPDPASLTEVLSMNQLSFTQKIVELSKRTVEGVLKSLKERIYAY